MSKSKKVGFNELIKGDTPVLIDFWATWCGPCRAMNPVLQQVAKQVGSDARIVKIDVDKHPQLAADLGVRGVPTLMVYKNGERKWMQAGVQSAANLVSILEQVKNSND